MNPTLTCTHCSNKIDISQVRCPHCAIPGLFPNVSKAGLDSERRALNVRYSKARDNLKNSGSTHIGDEFEKAVSTSKAIIARDILAVTKLLSNTSELYSTYHQQIHSGSRLSGGSKWDTLRSVTDKALFHPFEGEIRHAALTVDGKGLFSYGDCCMVLADNMIAHRTSVFEENSVTFMIQNDITFDGSDDLPKGFRAIWAERNRLCIAKLAHKLSTSTKRSDYPSILVHQGKTRADDSFVEAHIFGPISAYTLESHIIRKPGNPKMKVLAKGLQERCDKLKIGFQIV